MSALRAKREAIRTRREQRDPLELFLEGLEPSARRQYTDTLEAWKTFLEEMGEPDAVPDSENLPTFTWWRATNSKGRIKDKADVKTLSYFLGRFRKVYNATHEYQIKEDSLEKAREYLRRDAAAELGLENTSHEKTWANWKDIEILLHFIIAHDTHRYRDRRFRAQTVAFLLLLAENGERPGAILRSESRRSENTALTYGASRSFFSWRVLTYLLKDVTIKLRTAGKGSKFKIEIDYRYRKNDNAFRKRGRFPIEVFKETYYDRPTTPSSCVVSWILALAFMDNAFSDEINSPADLFKMENSGPSEKLITFKPEMRGIPIFRRLDLVSKIMSPTLPWTHGSAQTECQRVWRAAGFKGQFSAYSIRRALHNTCEDSGMSISSRRRLMGHRGAGDKTWETNYRSNRNTVDTGNMYRGLQPRKDKAEELCMHLSRDPEVLEAPKECISQAFTSDWILPRLLETRENLGREREQIKALPENELPEQGCNLVMIEAAFEALRLAINRRKIHLRKNARQTFRALYFEDPDKLRSQYPMAQVPVRASRELLVSTLYPESESEASLLAAVEAIVEHCSSSTTQAKTRSTDDSATKSRESDGAGSEDYYPRVKFVNPTTPRTSSMMSRTISKSLPLPSTIQFEQPCESGEDTRPKLWSKFEASEDSRLIHLKKTTTMSWEEIAEKFPNRTWLAIQQRYYRLIKLGVTTSEHVKKRKRKDEGDFGRLPPSQRRNATLAELEEECPAIVESLYELCPDTGKQILVHVL